MAFSHKVTINVLAQLILYSQIPTERNTSSGMCMVLSGRVLKCRSICRWFEPHRTHRAVSLSKTLYHLLNTDSTRKRLDMTKNAGCGLKHQLKTCFTSMQCRMAQLVER